MLNTPELTAIHSEEDNSKSSKDNNNKNNKNNNSENSKSEKIIKTKNNNPINNNNKYITIYYTALTYSQLYIITEKENHIYYKKYVIYWT